MRGWPMGGPASGPAFYEELGRVGNLTTLSICAYQTTDACVAAVCKHSQLKTLRLDGLEFVTSGVVDGILAGRAAGTICTLRIQGCCNDEGHLITDNIRYVDLVRLVKGCPKLTALYCTLTQRHLDATSTEMEFREIMARRDGYYEIDRN